MGAPVRIDTHRPVVIIDEPVTFEVYPEPHVEKWPLPVRIALFIALLIGGGTLYVWIGRLALERLV